MATLQEQIAAARLAKEQKANQPSALQAKIDAARKASEPEPSVFKQALQGGFKSIQSSLPDFAAEPLGIAANTMSGIPQTGVDTLNLLGTVQEYVNPFLSPGDLTKIPDVPLPAPDSNARGRTAAEWMTPLPGAKFNKVADTVIGGGAMLGEAIGDLYDSGETGEVAGGITGILASLLKGKAPSNLETATDYVSKNLQDITQAEAIAKIQDSANTGEVGTFADIVQDRGAFKVENAASAPGTVLADEISDIQKVRQAQLVEGVENAIPAEGDALALAAQRQAELANRGKVKIAQAEEQALQQADQIPGPDSQAIPAYQQMTAAQQQADVALEAVGSPYKPSEASQQLADTYDAKQLEAKLADDGSAQAWAAFDSAEPITAQQFKKSVFDWANENLTLTDAKMLKNKFGQTLNLVDDLDKVIAPKEVQSIISEIKRINNNASKPGSAEGFTSANKFLGGVQTALEKQLELVDESGDLYKAAREATKLEKGMFEPGRVGKARNLQEGQTLGRSLLDTNEGGAVVADNLLASNDPDIINQAQEYIKSVAQRDGIDEAFLTKYDELLDRFPELKNQFESVKATQDNLVNAEKSLEEAGKADIEAGKVLKQTVAKEKDLAKQAAKEKKAGLKKSVGNLELAKLRKNPTKYLDDALNEEMLGDAAPKTLNKLARQFSRIEGGDEALRKAVKERFINKINNPKGKNPSVDTKSVQDFHDTKRNLIDSGIMTKDEVMEIEKLMDKAEFSGLRKTLGPTKLNQAEEVLTDIGSSAAAIAALQVLPASNQLMLASTVKRIIKQKMGGSGADKKTLLALESIIKNPEKFLEGIASQKISSDEKLTGYIDKFIRSASQSVAEDKEE